MKDANEPVSAEDENWNLSRRVRELAQDPNVALRTLVIDLQKSPIREVTVTNNEDGSEEIQTKGAFDYCCRSLRRERPLLQ